MPLVNAAGFDTCEGQVCKGLFFVRDRFRAY
jgi:hypothetical protein